MKAVLVLLLVALPAGTTATGPAQAGGTNLACGGEGP